MLLGTTLVLPGRLQLLPCVCSMIMDPAAMRTSPLLLSSMLYIPFCSGVIAGVDFVAKDHERKKVPSVGKYVHTIYK